jgi:hypothetical protein
LTEKGDLRSKFVTNTVNSGIIADRISIAASKPCSSFLQQAHWVLAHSLLCVTIFSKFSFASIRFTENLQFERGKIMYDKEELCKKIQEIYPDIGECGIDINVNFDETQNAWVVHLKKDNRELKTFLEDTDAEKCMDGKQCVSLSIEINQLKDSIERYRTGM